MKVAAVVVLPELWNTGFDLKCLDETAVFDDRREDLYIDKS